MIDGSTDGYDAAQEVKRFSEVGFDSDVLDDRALRRHGRAIDTGVLCHCRNDEVHRFQVKRVHSLWRCNEGSDQGAC